MEAVWGGAVSYERGTPVAGMQAGRSLSTPEASGVSTGSWTGPPTSVEKGSKGRNKLDCIRGKGVSLRSGRGWQVLFWEWPIGQGQLGCRGLDSGKPMLLSESGSENNYPTPSNFWEESVM
jgi:hypothetical protein